MHLIFQFHEFALFGKGVRLSQHLKSFGVDEIRPGNFVFYDLMQAQIGACSLDDISVAVACPVVARHPERSQIVIYGGAIHFSKEQLRLANGAPSYGRLARLTPNSWQALSDASHISSLESPWPWPAHRRSSAARETGTGAARAEASVDPVDPVGRPAARAASRRAVGPT